MRVLVVEDHARLAETVATVLRREGMAVDVAFDGREALDRIALTAYDVVVLDRDLPGVHGDEVCRSLVAGGAPSSVLMLTAAATRRRPRRGPGPRGRRLPVQAVSPGRARGAHPRAVAPVARCAPADARARRPGAGLGAADGQPRRARPCRSARRSSRCSSCCWPPRATVVSTEQILEHAWDDATDPFTNAVRMTISRLRGKLGDPPVIDTVTPVGYRMGDAS